LQFHWSSNCFCCKPCSFFQNPTLAEFDHSILICFKFDRMVADLFVATFGCSDLFIAAFSFPKN